MPYDLNKDRKENMNTYDHVGTTELRSCVRFNYNMRWFWARAYKSLPFKSKWLKDLPLSEQKKVFIIHLN